MSTQYEAKPVRDFTVKTTGQSSSGSSNAWLHFGELYCGLDQVCLGFNFCQPCLDEAKSKDGGQKFAEAAIQRYKVSVSTSNLTSHLKNKHPGLPQPVNPNSKRAAITLIDYFNAEPGQGRKRAKSEGDKKYLHARQLSLYACRDLQAFSFVENEGFIDYAFSRGIVQMADDLPCEKTLRT